MNLTLINHPIWGSIRETAVQLGYFNRPLSTIIFLILLSTFFLVQKNTTMMKKIPRPFYLGIAISIPLIISYPFLSRDFFNYMFDARIVTFYNQNPYLLKALDFPNDHWLRFMHWTHRTYPYGPTFLLITLVPSFLSFGKLLLSIIFFKITWVSFYLAAIWIVEKKHKDFALFFATSPLVIFEGLINNHNDLIAICLIMIGMMAIFHKKKIKGYLLFFLSVGIKYFTLPYLFVQDKAKRINLFVFWALLAGFTYIGVTQGIQPWYLLNFVPILLVTKEMEGLFTAASAGVLLSYYPYVALGDWTNTEVIAYKNMIVLATFLFVLLVFFIKKTQLFKSEKV